MRLYFAAAPLTQPVCQESKCYVLVISVVFVPGSSARAATIRVTTKADEAGTGAACSLREAILSANANTGIGGCPAGSASTTDVIVLPAGTYTLSIAGTNEDAGLDGDLDITGSVRIEGAGDAVTVVDGNGGVVGERVVQVLSPAAVTFSGITIRNGRGQSGAGIFVSGATVHLVKSTVSDDLGGNGGGVDNISGTLTLVDSRVSDNRARFGQGGGIAGFNGATLSLTRSVVSGNVAFLGLGGGISATGGTTTLRRSTVSDNDAVGDLGGGIFNSMNGVLTIDRSTISGNHAGASGGGILNNIGPLTLTKSTVTGNTAEGNAGGVASGNSVTSIVDSTISGNRATGSGAGLMSNGTPGVTISNSTVSGNIADADGDGSGDGEGLFRTAGSVVLVNTIVAGNVDSWGEAPDCTGDIGTQGFNLVGANSGCIASPAQGDQIGTVGAPIDPRLAPLADNGGPTQTRALLPGSPGHRRRQSPRARQRRHRVRRHRPARRPPFGL